MSRVVTPEQCLEAIQADSAWRKKEIASLKNRVLRSRAESQGGILARAGILILYAHWEGFVKMSASTYIEHINERIRICGPTLTEHYQRLLMWCTVKRSGNSTESRSPILFLDALDTWQNSPQKALDAKMIDAESNLSYDVLRKILRIIDVPCDYFDSKKNLIDHKLLKLRNDIAHGGRRPVSIEEYVETDEETRALLDVFQERIEDCVARSSYSTSPT